MTQHYWKTVTKQGQQCMVQIGWDRPLQTFYCTVFNEDPVKEDDKDTEERILYSNIDDIEICFSGYVDLIYYQGILKEQFGIILPRGLVLALAGDKEENAGNKIRHWH